MRGWGRRVWRQEGKGGEWVEVKSEIIILKLQDGVALKPGEVKPVVFAPRLKMYPDILCIFSLTPLTPRPGFTYIM